MDENHFHLLHLIKTYNILNSLSKIYEIVHFPYDILCNPRFRLTGKIINIPKNNLIQQETNYSHKEHSSEDKKINIHSAKKFQYEEFDPRVSRHLELIKKKIQNKKDKYHHSNKKNKDHSNKKNKDHSKNKK